jgi:hypothetical protein
MQVPASCQPAVGLWNQPDFSAEQIPNNRARLERRSRLAFEAERDLPPGAWVGPSLFG